MRAQFPQISRRVREIPLVYLDSAATTLKTKSVIEAVSHHYTHDVANIHRGAHFLGDQGTTKFEAVREKARAFLNAQSCDEIVFTKGTTEGLNLLAHTLATELKAGDEILLTEMEHHSNIVPWQLAGEPRGVKIKSVKVTESGELDMDDFRSQLTGRVKILSVTHLSNVLGTVNPVEDLIKEARAKGVITVVDAAQSVGLGLVDVQRLNCDFLVFSGHKIYGPTGVGVVFGRREIFSRLPPYQGGGSMIEEVTFERTTYLGLPQRFEAGTPAIAEVIGLGAALDFLRSIDFSALKAKEKRLNDRATEGLRELGAKIIGQSPTRTNILSFVLPGAHPSDVGQLLDQEGVAVRTGHLCCQPLMKRMGLTGTVRLSFAVYTNEEDIERFLASFKKVRGILL